MVENVSEESHRTREGLGVCYFAHDTSRACNNSQS